MDTGAHPCPQLSKAGVTPCGIAAEAEPHAVPHLKQHTQSNGGCHRVTLPASGRVGPEGLSINVHTVVVWMPQLPRVPG